MERDTDDIPLTKPIRLIELVLCMVLVGLLIDIGSVIAVRTYLQLMYVAFGGFLMITLTDVTSQIAADPIPDTPMFLLALAGCALFLAAGGVSLDCHLDMTKLNLLPDAAKMKRIVIELVVIASLSFLNGAIFLLDAALIFRDQTRVKKLSKKPTSKEIEDRLMAATKFHAVGVRSDSGNRGDHGLMRETFSHSHHHLFENYISSYEEEVHPLPGAPQFPERHEEVTKISFLGPEGNFLQLSSSRPSSRARVNRATSPRRVMIVEADDQSTPRSGGPNGKRRRGRKWCRALIWQKERIISVFFKVLESALGIACLWIFVRNIWLEDSKSPPATAITFSAIVTATALATALTINTLAGNPAHRISFLLAAVTGAVLYYLIVFIRFYYKDNLSIKMETPVLITGAVSLVDAALCLATFINMETNNAAGEQPQRPARRADKVQKKPDPTPEELTAKKAKKTSLFLRAKKYFKKSEPQ